MPPKKKSKSTRSNMKANVDLLDDEAESLLSQRPRCVIHSRHPLEEDDWIELPMCRLERQMELFSQAIRGKPNWMVKVKDEKICKKWVEEAIQESKKQPPPHLAYTYRGTELTPAAARYIIEENRWLADQIVEGTIEMSPVMGVFQSDGLIEDELKRELLSNAKLLEDVPEDERDWHPGSSKQVLDLIHPSLYCFVYGRTYQVERQMKPTLLSTGASIMTPLPPPADVPRPIRYNLMGEASYDSDSALSKRFHWLPSEFIVDEEGRVKIDSYVNNLHPVKHKKMYGTLAKVFERFVPLLGRVLDAPRINRIDPHLADYIASRSRERIKEMIAMERYNEMNEGGEVAEENEDEWYDRVQEMKYEAKVPEKFKPTPEKFVDLRGRRLQVIVKMANIELTPESPEYKGGSWHVEGMLNERIVATCIYYYASNNISESRLAFRRRVRQPYTGDEQTEQSEGVTECHQIFGLGVWNSSLNETLGSVETKEGRCIVFPNINQHMVSPFRLADATRPGSRKILVFFLVDPDMRITSTARVPPQQHDWLWDELKACEPFSSLPRDILNLIEGYCGFLMKREEAERIRLELMEERSAMVQNVNAGEILGGKRGLKSLSVSRLKPMTSDEDMTSYDEHQMKIRECADVFIRHIFDMGALLSLFWSSKEYRMLVLGLDNAGKTTILYKLKLGEVVRTIPTIGFNVETVQYRNLNLTLWDAGGQDKIIALWRCYLQNTSSLIYVIDSTDRERLAKAREEMQKILENDEMKDVCMAVLANKSDLPGAMTSKEVADGLGLMNIRNRKWYIQSTCANTEIDPEDPQLMATVPHLTLPIRLWG
ncbi:hypothetical protein PROFUN_05919 [Planoprotostelium fungivorum]|uniref:Uncharacterized protein n=1 Tax=Planoprotostelium fungivorum TaxID=1890364 RepID=A0A2P6N7L4_9EUKA|nr:hypothetical protein PROFUN_05919 [Planoprotostelium fungivorum]